LYESVNASRELERIIDESEENGGDITAIEGFFAEVAAKADNLPAAVDDVLSLVKFIEYRAEARKAEAKRMADRAKRDESVAAYMKGQVLAILMEQGKKVMETARFRVTVAQPGGKAAMEIVGDVPPEFTTEKIEILPDKDAIREALESGATLDFARIVPKQPYLRIS
jgi:hypothetical protein